MKQQRKNLKLVHRIEAAVILTAVLIFAASGVYMYRQRKAAEVQAAGRVSVASQTEIEEGPLFARNTVEYEGQAYKRNTYVKAILLMGVDRRGSMEESTTTGFGGQADGIFLVAQDTVRNSLQILMIPRDTMTKIILTDLSGNILGKDVQHLTLAYAYGDGREKSCEYMAEAVTDLTGGLAIDSYLAVDMDVISILNDAVGGVTVTIPTEGMEKTDPAFIKGEQVTLNGKQAEAFVRFRDTEKSHSALYRMDQQKEYMDRFYQAIQEKSQNDSRVVEQLFDQINAYMVTDMKKDQYLKLAMDALNTKGFSSKDIYTVPGQGVSTAKYDEFYPDQEGLTTLILDMFYRETN